MSEYYDIAESVVLNIYPNTERVSVLDKMHFRALDADFNATEILDAYDSIIWTEKYNEVGDFEIHGGISDQLISILNTSPYIFNSVTSTLMIIESPNVNYDEEEGDTLTIKGRSFSSILDRRIILTTYTVMNPTDARISQIICDLVSDAFALSDSQSPRYWDKLEVVNSTSVSSVELPTDVGLQFTMGDSILKIVTDICNAFNLGFKFEYSIADDVVKFIVYEGVDHSVQGEDLIVFSDLYDNLLSSNETIDFSSEKNTILVIGNAEDPNNENLPKLPQVLSPDSPTGLSRREMFLKADVDDVIHNGDDPPTTSTMTNAEYIALLEQAGLDELNKLDNKIRRYYEGEIIETLKCSYGEESSTGSEIFSLGDVIVFRMPHSSFATARLDAITFSDDANEGKTLAPSFDYGQNGS